jgi:hypothetical protein
MARSELGVIPDLFNRQCKRGVEAVGPRGHQPVAQGPIGCTAIAVTLALGIALSGCAMAPVKGPEPAPAISSLQEYMQQGGKAAADGSAGRARETYRTAAKAYPASKEPWLKLAEDYFEASDYGNAILSAQEVMLRDSNDNIAASILAVSGLRVSATALQSIRSQNRIAGNTRTEAETMARTLRDVLGETVLVPRPASPASAPVVSNPIRPKPRPAVASSPSKPVAPQPSANSNPFDKLR